MNTKNLKTIIMSNKYISKENKKAYTHFKRLGCTLKERTKEKYLCCSICNPTPIASYKVYEVSGGRFDEMSGREFNKYLKKNNLLLKQA